MITLCGFGYYKWCASHPEINIQVSESTAGNNLKIEAPQIIYTTRHGIELDLSVKNGKTIMHYYGKATTFAGKEENYDIETKLDFAINAKIK